MTKDDQVLEMKKLLNEGKTLKLAAMKAGMDTKTARKYRDSDQLPGGLKATHLWRTRKDPFKEVWPEIKERLQIFPALEAKTLFEALQRDYPGHFEDGQLRTLQRRIKRWRATEGPSKEVFFPQEHKPAELGASDFTCMNRLEVTINRQPFNHLLYHFVLTYSNWETGSICFSESFESLSEGLQKALWHLGGVPKKHRTDNLSAAVNNLSDKKEFTQRYNALLRYYKLTGDKIQPGKANENGDVEQRHFRLKRAVDQALMLRGSREFETRRDYKHFLTGVFAQLNKGRQNRFREEMKLLRILPAAKFDGSKELKVRVGPSSTIRVQNNVYSVYSRLIREWVDIRVHADYLDIFYAQKRVDRIPRLRGENRHKIQYRHIIDWLVRKPGAFSNFRYRSDLFPSSYFRMTYDILREQNLKTADKEYLKILNLAAKETETGVNEVLKLLIDREQSIDEASVKRLVLEKLQPQRVKDPVIENINLKLYDDLLTFNQEVS